MYYKYGWSNSEYLTSRPNNLIFHTLCSGLIFPQAKSIDLGHTDKKAFDLLSDPLLTLFMCTDWGAEEVFGFCLWRKAF